ncbi:MAG: flagellar biosynthesis anti-sigma factor FlgM [Magnetococcales bacterium]|nr:flagellar biosynthesis anti-sigma factor FlgM [Magnetococcales bacterium]MBF0438491.1 flagellar biosynthesis anti-sigma factor FlgM [Magnetococcales bacterium]
MVTRIKSVNVGQLGRISRKRTGGKTSGSTSSTSSARADDASFSPGARTMGMANDAINDAPDIRADLVEPIREAVANGRYQVSSLDVADKILRQIIMERKKSL